MKLPACISHSPELCQNDTMRFPGVVSPCSTLQEVCLGPGTQRGSREVLQLEMGFKSPSHPLEYPRKNPQDASHLLQTQAKFMLFKS